MKKKLEKETGTLVGEERASVADINLSKERLLPEEKKKTRRKIKG